MHLKVLDTFLGNISIRDIIFLKFHLPGYLGWLFGEVRKLSELYTIK